MTLKTTSTFKNLNILLNTVLTSNEASSAAWQKANEALQCFYLERRCWRTLPMRIDTQGSSQLLQRDLGVLLLFRIDVGLGLLQCYELTLAIIL